MTGPPLPERPAGDPGVTVIGLDGGPIAPSAAAAIDAATCVVGAERHLDAVTVPPGARTVRLGDLASSIEVVAERPGPTVVLASGDPGFFGIVRALRDRGIVPRVIPAVSSVAMAFARIGLAWDDALVVSAHGRSPRRALAAALAHPKAAILTAPGDAGPDVFLPALLRAGRDVYVAQRLGTAEESVVRVPAEDGGAWRAPNVVLTVDPRHAVAPAMPWLSGHQGAPHGWALPEEEFERRDSLITKSEVRAVALAHLAPRPGHVVWDIGAGSGSVAVECARFGAHAVAFERNPEDRDRIRANAARHGVHIDVGGEVPDALERDQGGRLPADRIFVGGGDETALRGALTATAAERVVIALASLDRVRPSYELLAAHGYHTEGTQLHASRITGLPNGALRLAARNPVFLLWGHRPARPLHPTTAEGNR